MNFGADTSRELGARSSEKAARWIRTMESALKPPRKDELVSCSHTRWQAFRWDAAHARAFKLQENNDAYMLSRCSNRMHSIGWTVFSSVHNDPMASDVIAPSPWTIFDCKNGKRWWFRGEGNSCMKQRLHILLMTILASYS
ncbi:uncharacterized protein [Oryza sativa Japonica Group]|uniref:uncharacterized protein isoform X2 n=1 Tax=Oryza sativa subsp. japonica TaxID=39947 RepID=UPI00339C841C